MERKQADVRQFDGSRHGFCHCIWDIVEFEIEEDLCAGVREHLNCPRTLGSKELTPNFEEADYPAKPARQGAGRPQAVNVKGDD